MESPRARQAAASAREAAWRREVTDQLAGITTMLNESRKPSLSARVGAVSLVGASALAVYLGSTNALAASSLSAQALQEQGYVQVNLNHGDQEQQAEAILLRQRPQTPRLIAEEKKDSAESNQDYMESNQIYETGILDQQEAAHAQLVSTAQLAAGSAAGGAVLGWMVPFVLADWEPWAGASTSQRLAREAYRKFRRLLGR
jgi:hypothetical protein